MKIVFQNVMPCGLLDSSTQCGGSSFFQNIHTLLSEYLAAHPPIQFSFIHHSDDLISQTMISMFMGGCIVQNCGDSSWDCVISSQQM
jgi:hypothetical protein